MSVTLTQTPSAPSPVCKGERAAPGHRVHGIFDEVHQDLLHLRCINRCRRQLPRQFRFHRDASIFNFRPQQIEGLFDHVIQHREFQLQRRRPDGAEKLRDDVIQPGDFAFGHAQILFQFVGNLCVVTGDG